MLLHFLLPPFSVIPVCVHSFVDNPHRLLPVIPVCVQPFVDAFGVGLAEVPYPAHNTKGSS